MQPRPGRRGRARRRTCPRTCCCAGRTARCTRPSGGAAAGGTYRPGETPTHTDPDLPERLARALRRGVSASEDGGLRVHYQPIVRIADGATVALEALARWTDPAGGPVPPDVFVAVAERAGLVGELDDLVLDQACRDLAALRRARPRAGRARQRLRHPAGTTRSWSGR